MTNITKFKKRCRPRSRQIFCHDIKIIQIWIRLYPDEIDSRSQIYKYKYNINLDLSSADQFTAFKKVDLDLI